jgi:tetratricopeptide (TPR) repeat protein
MKNTLNAIPDLPLEIENAAQSGELVVFVGAGISRLINCPSWDDFANRVLEQLAPNGIDYYDLSQIRNIADPKKRLSLALIVAEKKKIGIDYSTILMVKPEMEHYRKAVKADPNSAVVHYNVALTLDKMGKHEDATASFKKALELAPDDPSIKDSEILKKHVGMS